MLSDLRLALRFLTRLPVDPADWHPGDLGRAAWAFPLIGVLVGLLGGVAYAVGRGIGLTPILAAIAATGAMVWVTGGLHEDGLADMADALGGGNREKRLDIMRDPHIGSYGVIALVLLLSARVFAVAGIGATGAALGALVIAAAAGRAAIAVPLALLGPARPDGLGAEAGRPSWEWLAMALGLLVLATVMEQRWTGAAAVLLAFAAAALVALVANAKFGGQTGDVLGAAEQLAEVTALAALVALA